MLCDLIWKICLIVALTDVSSTVIRTCSNRCYDRNHELCGILSYNCDELLVRIVCPRTCGGCHCKLVTCEDGTCVDIWEPSLCKEYKIANKCAWTRFNPLGNCARTCGDCEQCNLPCSAKCQDFGEKVKCEYFATHRLCKRKNDAARLCPKSCGVCRKCPTSTKEVSLAFLNRSTTPFP